MNQKPPPNTRDNRPDYYAPRGEQFLHNFIPTHAIIIIARPSGNVGGYGSTVVTMVFPETKTELKLTPSPPHQFFCT